VQKNARQKGSIVLQEILDDLSDIKVSEQTGQGEGYMAVQAASAFIDCSGFLSCCCCCCVL
jgi:hypothetical protein